MAAFLLPCATPWLSLIAVWFSRGATHGGQPWTPVWTLPHRRDGLSARRMVVVSTFRKLSIYRQVGFDHGVGHPLLLLCDAKAANG